MEFDYSVEVKIPFQTQRQSQIAKTTLEPDPILKPSDLKVEYSTQDNVFIVNFSGVSDRVLRVAISSVLESLKTVIETMDEFEGKINEYLA